MCKRSTISLMALSCLSAAAATVMLAAADSAGAKGQAPGKKPVRAASEARHLAAIRRKSAQRPPENAATRNEGKKVYELHCLSCHGEKGKGDGQAAYLLYPQPRDFSKSLFKVRTTPSGSLPTDGDMFWAVTRGMPGSAMPSFRLLSERDRWAVVYYVKTFVEAYQYRQPEPPIAVPPEPPLTAQSIALGKRMYKKMECYKCHGEKGMGDGPSAEDQKDDWGYPVRVRDFTDGVYKGGPTDRDLYLRFTTGMTGSPMPAYSGKKMNATERWGLVHFVRSLRRKDRPLISAPPDGILIAQKVAGSIPTDDPGAVVWQQAKVYSIPLNPLFQRERAAPLTSHVRIRALWNDSQIAFLLEWDDANRNSRMLKIREFRDGAAVQFALGGDKLTYLGMGHKDISSNIWHWKADWQADMEEAADLKKRFPNMHADFYPFTNGDGEQEDLFLTARAAGNPFSLAGRASPIEDLNAVGFGTLTPQAAEEQNVQGKGAWTGKVWRVLFVRPLNSAGTDDVKFSTERTVPVAFAIWDGALSDRDGQKLVSSWYRLKWK